jgi:hypothetical protein
MGSQAHARTSWRRAGTLLRRMAGALVIGVATILLVKREADQHWSDPPMITVIPTYDQAAHPDEPDQVPTQS